MEATQHLEALAHAYEAAMGEVARTAQAAHARIDGDLEALSERNGAGRPPLIPNVPVDEPPPYIPPAPSMTAHHALIPDTPLVEKPFSSSSLAFDDAPLWQS
jgi:hypothetical protein